MNGLENRFPPETILQGYAGNVPGHRTVEGHVLLHEVVADAEALRDYRDGATSSEKRTGLDIEEPCATCRLPLGKLRLRETDTVELSANGRSGRPDSRDAVTRPAMPLGKGIGSVSPACLRAGSRGRIGCLDLP